MSIEPLGLFIQPACLQHKYIRHANSSHIFERPERLRAVLLGVAAAVARLEEQLQLDTSTDISCTDQTGSGAEIAESQRDKKNAGDNDDLTSLLSSLSIASASTPSSFSFPQHLVIVHPPPTQPTPGQILLHHPALQLSHSPPTEAPFPYFGSGPSSSSSTGARGSQAVLPSSKYMRDLLKWAMEAPERIKNTGCEIPPGLGLNQGDLYLGPGSVVAIEGAVQTVCQAVDMVLSPMTKNDPTEPSTPPVSSSIDNVSNHTPPNPGISPYFITEHSVTSGSKPFRKAFCAIRPPGHHCGEDAPSGFCYVNNVVVGAMHAYLEHDIDRAIIIDFDLHHGNGTQALIMPLNAASYAEDLALKAGKPPTTLRGKEGRTRRGWKGFYGSVHDIYSYPCEDGDVDLVKDASISLAAHGQYIENIHLQPYSSEQDFYERIYPKYLALLDKARVYMDETDADPERTIVFISAGFDACEHEHQLMQRHDRRVPVSFFSRYTRDIAKFANENCRGRVVSVLEGGYSDRALTSAAMGHVMGMLGKEGRGDWWTVEELEKVERATKKKRTGKIAPFPPELSHLPHLARTHALLAYFESVGLPPEAPSSQSTPQQAAAGRMTLRTRRAGAEDEASVTPPPISRRGRGRGVVTPTTGGTPRPRKAGTSPSKVTASSSAPALMKAAAVKGADVDDLIGQIGRVKVDDQAKAERSPPAKDGPDSAVILPPISDLGAANSPTAAPEPAGSLPPPYAPTTASHVETSSSVHNAQKIILRFRRPESATPPLIPSPTTTSFPSTSTTTTSLYPALPPKPSNVHAQNDRMVYREQSSEVSTSGTEGEYLTAESDGEAREGGTG